MLKRFLAVRSQLNKQTAIALRWDNVNGVNFDPKRVPNPVHEVPGPGDGTVPYWSAFHTSSVNASN